MSTGSLGKHGTIRLRGRSIIWLFSGARKTLDKATVRHIPDCGVTLLVFCACMRSLVFFLLDLVYGTDLLDVGTEELYGQKGINKYYWEKNRYSVCFFICQNKIGQYSLKRQTHTTDRNISTSTLFLTTYEVLDYKQAMWEWLLHGKHT